MRNSPPTMQSHSWSTPSLCDRAERQNDDFYQLLADTPFAAFVKTCDRICNMQNSVKTNNQMIFKYIKECEHFRQKTANISMSRVVSIEETKVSYAVSCILEKVVNEYEKRPS